jgi:predicted DNA-binding protein YlxM (UPF0122 family)
MFLIKVAEKKHTFMFNNFFFENRVVYEIVEKYCRAGQAIDDNIAHAHCMLDN